MEQLFHQLKQLRLGHAATALTLQQEQPGTYHDLSFEERLSLLLESELQNRHQTRIQKLKQQAKLRLNASVNQISYRGDRGLNKAQLSELLNGGYLHRKQNILITGPTGAGKTYLACAFGSQACEQQHGVLGIFRPKTTKCSGGPAVCGLQRGITFFEIPIWALFE